MLDQEKFDVIFVDLNIGNDLGLNFLPAVRDPRVNADAKLFMVSGTIDSDAALDALQRGFSDFITKDDLDAAGFERATVNAVKQLFLTRSADTAVAETKSMEQVLNAFAGVCLNEMRPLLARLRRQARQVKADQPEGSTTFDELIEVEATCSRIEEFFVDLNGMA